MKGDTMKQDYMNNQASTNIIVGFSYHGLYYYAEVSLRSFLKMSKYDKTSKSHGRKACLRFKPTVKQKEEMIKTYSCGGKTILLCTEADLQNKRIGRENRGQTFERLICEIYQGEPCINRFWWNGADFKKGWSTYQVKLENGTLCTAEQCRKLRAEA